MTATNMCSNFVGKRYSPLLRESWNEGAVSVKEKWNTQVSCVR